jgi:Ca2+-transporting ATPase
MLWVGTLIGALSLLAQAWGVASGSGHGGTMAFTVLALAQLAHVMAIRSERESLFRQGIATNRPLLAAVVATAALQLAAVYLPFFNATLGTHPLSAAELALCVALSIVTFVAVEAEKWLVRRGRLYAAPAR